MRFSRLSRPRKILDEKMFAGRIILGNMPGQRPYSIAATGPSKDCNLAWEKVRERRVQWISDPTSGPARSEVERNIYLNFRCRRRKIRMSCESMVEAIMLEIILAR